MRDAMRIIGKVSLFVFVLVAPALAQTRLVAEPPPAAAGPAYDVSVGYTNLTMAVPPARHVNLNGLDVSGRVDLNSRWGMMVDSTYVRTSNILSTPKSGHILSFLTGPVFYPVEHGNTRMFVDVLAGTGLVGGATPGSDGQYYHGWLLRFAYAGGVGVEHFVSGPFSVRVGGDYLHTAFYDSVGAVRPQNNMRVTVSFVYRLAGRHPGGVR